MTTEMFDIIIPVACPDEKLGEALSMLEIQTAKPAAVILMETVPEVTGENAEGSAELKKLAKEKLPGIAFIIRAVSRKDFDHASTRREAVRLSRSPVFLMMTQDAVPENRELCKALLEAVGGGAAMAYARQVAGKDAGDIEKVTREFNYPAAARIKTKDDIPSLGIKAFFASNVCCAYSRETYDALGGFPDHAIFNEDMIYARKVLDAGKKIAYVPEALCRHSHNYSARQQFQRNFDLGISQADHPETFGGIRSEGEGVRLVLSTMKRVSPFSWPRLFVQSAAKYLGYRLGKGYRCLGMKTIRKCTSNPAYVDKYITEKK